MERQPQSARERWSDGDGVSLEVHAHLIFVEHNDGETMLEEFVNRLFDNQFSSGVTYNSIVKST